MTKPFRKIEAKQLHFQATSQLHPANSYFHFSFANYVNPDNIRFGVLRVLNDDEIKPHSGFGEHPHRDVEIVSYIVRGKLSHWDSVTDQQQVLEQGHVQAITAGTGLWHSEQNHDDDWNRLLQIWILPPTNGLPVRYSHHTYLPHERQNRLLQIVGNPASQEQPPLQLYQDVNIFVSELNQPELTLAYRLEQGRQAYINNIEGSLAIDGITTLDQRDSLAATGPLELRFCQNGQPCHFIIIEMATDAGQK